MTYRVGGEVEDGGEKLRVDTPDSAEFEPKKDYILILRRDKNASVQQYFIPMGQTITVTNDKVYPISGRFSWLSGMDAFPAGSDYSAIQGTFFGREVRVEVPNVMRALVLAMAPGEDGQSFTSAKMAIFQDNAWQPHQEMSMEAYLSMTPSFQYTVPDAPYRFVVMQRMIVPAAN